ncbi:MAG: hypothetical protein AUI53_00975 [Acidobacteria bacterium 13_1_40CM_2_60_7]|nr:MAG: hypothetical protein AUI53_00975 [Acidobacteria bacterium 13_1_40CM_2_60_7]
MCASTGARKVVRCEFQKALARPKSAAANPSPTLPEARDAHFCTLQALPGVQFRQAAGKDRFSLRPCPREVRMRGTVVFLAVLCVAAVAASSSRQTQTQEKPEEAKIPPEAAKRENPVKPTPQGLAEAKRLYGYDCAFCHGAAGDGKGDVAAEMKLTLKDWRDPAALAGMTEGRLNDTQAWQMVNYVRSLVKKNSEEKPKADAPKQ